ncbi:MAG: uridine kinase [Saprospiraceae bacterium]|nr:uridine kinase [Saprospiraceae bacterium]
MFIGICGGSGAGKTAFINQLRTRFTESELGLISEDNYYFPMPLQKTDNRGVINFDIPESIDHEAFISDLYKLRRGEVVSRAEYTFNNDQSRAKLLQIPPAKIYIIEGLFILYHQDTRDLLDLSILIHAKDNLKIIRRINRDKEERNYPIEDVLYRYQYHVAPAYDRYIDPYIDELDLIINNNNSFDKGVDVLSAFIQSNL